MVLHAIRQACPRTRLTGSDVRSDGLRLARSRLPGVSLYQIDARQIPFRDHFDVVGAFDVIEHMEDDEAALREIGRALKPGGGLLLTVPQHRFLWSAADDFSRHKRRYSRAEIVGTLRRSSFTVLSATSFFTFLLPVQLAVRWRQRRCHTPFDPRSELRVPAGVNTLLDWLSRFEQLAPRAGVSLPAGGSLLVVARRQFS